MNLVVHGSRASDSLVMVEGMPIINGSGTGGLQYGNYLNNALAQEITFQTDSHNAEFERATRLLELHPEGRVEHLPRLLPDAATPARAGSRTTWTTTQIAQGLRSGNRINRIWDVNPARGGPIIKDRLWVYGVVPALGHLQHRRRLVQGQGFLGDLFYEPTTEQNLFPVWHQSAVARVSRRRSTRGTR